MRLGWWAATSARVGVVYRADSRLEKTADCSGGRWERKATTLAGMALLGSGGPAAAEGMARAGARQGREVVGGSIPCRAWGACVRLQQHAKARG